MSVTPIDYVLLLERNYPTAVFGGSCETYDRINWKDTTTPKPSASQLDAEWSVLEVQLEMESKLLSLSNLSGLDVIAGFRSSAFAYQSLSESEP